MEVPPSITEISFCVKKKTKNLPAIFFFNLKIPELSNLFAPVIKHLIPWLSYSAKSSMSCWVTYMINSCPVCDMARRSFLLNCMSTVLIFPCHEYLTP